MRKLCLSLAAAAVFAAAPALAADAPEPPITNPTSIVDSVGPDQFAEMMRELGAQQVQIREAEGQKIVTFFNGEVPYNVGFGLCDIRPGKCLALTMIVVINLGTGTAPALETLNAANGGMYVTAVRVDANRFAVGRVEIVDGGVTKKNLAINAGSFIATFQALMRGLNEQVVASVQPRSSYLSAPTRPRAVFATPREMARITKAMSANYAAYLSTLARSRR
jgi:hypothetical protein